MPKTNGGGFELRDDERRLAHRAAERWAPKLSRVYSGVRGCGYPVPQMLRDRDLLKGDDHNPGLIAVLDPQGELFDERSRNGGEIQLPLDERRVLWYALRNYRDHLEGLRKDEIKAGHSVDEHDADLEAIGEWDPEEHEAQGGLLEALYAGWESAEEESDPAQGELV